MRVDARVPYGREGCASVGGKNAGEEEVGEGGKRDGRGTYSEEEEERDWNVKELSTGRASTRAGGVVASCSLPAVQARSSSAPSRFFPLHKFPGPASCSSLLQSIRSLMGSRRRSPRCSSCLSLHPKCKVPRSTSTYSFAWRAHAHLVGPSATPMASYQRHSLTQASPTYKALPRPM